MANCAAHSAYTWSCDTCRSRKLKVYLGWPSTGQREDVHMYLLRDLQDRYGELLEFVLPDVCCHRMMHDRARNDIVEEFLASSCDVLWQLDSDVIPPHHVLDLIAHHYDKWQVAGAPYPVYQMIPGTDEMSICFTVYNGLGKDPSSGQRGIFLSDLPPAGTDFVDALATGCLFIKREVFAKLEKPYFEFKFDKETRRITEGEDLGFALKLHDLGIRFFTDYGAVCEHNKRVGLLQMTNYAMRRENARVLEYDKQIREQVDIAIKAAFNAGLKKGRDEAPSAPQIPKTKSGLILPNSFRT